MQLISEMTHVHFAGKAQLKYNWSNVCMHYFTLEFLEQAAEHVRTEGVYHIAKKKIPSKDGPVQVLHSTRLCRCTLEPFQDCHHDLHGVQQQQSSVLDDSIGMQIEITLMTDADFVSCHASLCSWKGPRRRRSSYLKVYARHS